MSESDEDFVDLFDKLNAFHGVTEDDDAHRFDMFDLELGVITLDECKLSTEWVTDDLRRALSLAKAMIKCDFETIMKSDVFHALFRTDDSGDDQPRTVQKTAELIQGRIKRYGNEFEVLMMGACLLQCFVQANYTGPPLSKSLPYPLPIHEGEEGQSKGNGAEYRQRLEADARAASASSNKSINSLDLDPHPRLHYDVGQYLESCGEYVLLNCKNLDYLYGCKVIFDTLPASTSSLISLNWWRARYACVHQQTLESREISFDLKQMAEESFTRASKEIDAFRSSVKDISLDRIDTVVLAQLYLEWGIARTKFGMVENGKRNLDECLKRMKVTLELSGALGKRTKFQIESKSQLKLLTKSTSDVKTQSTPVGNGPSIQRIEINSAETVDPVTGEYTFGRVLEAGIRTVQLEELDEHTPLHERIVYDNGAEDVDGAIIDGGEREQLHQSVVLAYCVDIKNNNAMSELTTEQMLAYVGNATERPLNFTVHATALYLKSRLQFEKYKTKERSVLQMQVLVDQQHDRLTPLQFRQRDVGEDSAPANVRLRWVHALFWPPIWRLKRNLADRYKDLGVVGSALQIYEELRSWEDCVSCLIMQDKKARAEELLRERLTVEPNSPSLWCTLGDLIESSECLEKAWVVSGYRYARAKRLLGSSAFKNDDFPSAKTHLLSALEVNPNYPWAWFRLGVCALRLHDLILAKTSFAKVVNLEPEDAEAWGNLSTVLIQLKEYEQGFHAISEAVKYANMNWKIWDSYLTLSLKCGKYENSLLAMETLIDLGARRADGGGGRRVDPEALLHVANYVLKQYSINAGSGNQEFLDRLLQRFDNFVDKMKMKCESQSDVWVVLSHYYEQLKRVDKQRDCILRRLRALLRDFPTWFECKDEAEKSGARFILKTSVTLCAVTLKLPSDQITHAREETVLMIRNVLSKRQVRTSPDYTLDDSLEDLFGKLESALESLLK